MKCMTLSVSQLKLMKKLDMNKDELCLMVTKNISVGSSLETEEDRNVA